MHSVEAYWKVFGGLCTLCVALLAREIFQASRETGDASSETSSDSKSDPRHGSDPAAAFARFQRSYLVVYYTVMFADWLQGPYVYALYLDYGFDKSAIAVLFSLGFLSSMVFGTLVGGVADKFGRKRLAVAFSIFYGLACVLKLFNNFWMLAMGRLLSGIATSLLFSVFEAWMVSEHHKRGFSDAQLSSTFSLGTRGNSIAAILAGVLATFLADRFGYVSPFMASLVCLVAAGVYVAATWSENYGDQKIEVGHIFSGAATTIKEDPKVAMVGLIQALYEGAMYTFVFMWTPTITEHTVGFVPPFGLIFATFMVAVMLGSYLFSSAMAGGIPLQQTGLGLLVAAAIALSTPIFNTSTVANFGAFLVFEATCGMYWPVFGMLRSRLIPEDQRSAVMNMFRIPLNAVVVAVLTQAGTLSTRAVFTLCSGFLCAAVVLQVALAQALAVPPPPVSGTDADGKKDL